MPDRDLNENMKKSKGGKEFIKAKKKERKKEHMKVNKLDS